MNRDLQSLIDDLTFFIDIHPKFNGKLVDDIITQYERNGTITEKQITTLLSIHSDWKVSEYLQIKCYGELIDDEMF